MESLGVTSDLMLLLFLVGFLAGLVDAMAGGGGLIALPALLFAGLPPQVALGTNKLQGCFGTLSASYSYCRSGTASLRSALPGIAVTLVGATAGACLVQRLDPGFIEPLIPVLLLAVLLYTLFSRNLGRIDSRPLLPSGRFYLFFGLTLGFYDGFFGPGTGSFWTVAMMSLLGYNMTKATGYTKLMNATSNLAALGWFMLGGNVCYQVGLVMAAGQLLGGRAGAQLAISRGRNLIRPVFLTVVMVTILKLFQN